MNVNPTLVCFALKEEAGPFRIGMVNCTHVSILLTGIGHKNADRTVREFLSNNSPARVLTSGFAGGLDPELALGDIVFETQDSTFAERLVAAGAKPARIFSALRIATTVAGKRELRLKMGADAVEMESGAIHTICRERGVSCATVRAISDTAGDDLPFDFNELAKADLSPDYGKLAAAVLKNPSKIPALLRLQKNCNLAAQRLADILLRVV
jgi:adenosylhomocysteine nucleosidase